MADEPADNGFRVSYPAWIFVHQNSIARNAAGEVRFKHPIRWYLLKDNEGKDAIPIFTDEDLAIRFLATSPVDGAEMIGARDQQELVEWLQLVQGMNKASLVAFDPAASIGSTRRCWFIDDVITSLQNNTDLR